MEYLNDADVLDVRQSEPPANRSRSGYGRKLPTSWEIRLVDGRWRRVYVIQYSNAGTAYIRKGEKNLYLGSFEPSLFRKGSR